MKRVIIFIFIAVLCAIISPFGSMLAQPSHVPHQNPATAEDSSDTASLLNLYGNIFNLAALRQYHDAQSMLNELEHANIPKELRYLTDRFNDLSQQLFIAANNLEFVLDKASTLFSENQIIEARQLLDSAEVVIHDTLLLMDDTETAASAIGDALGVFTVLAGSEITIAYERLEETLHRLRQTIDELNQLRERISDNPQAVIDTQFYLPTQLEVSAPETAHPGLPFTISGKVSYTDGTANRMVKILLDDIQFAEEIVEGQFSFQVTPPQQISIGKHSLVVVVTPQGRYSGISRSLSINISQLPIQTDVRMPRVTFFSNLIQVMGRVYHSLGPLENAEVSVTFRQASTMVRTSSDGSFVTTIEVPFDLSLIGPQEIAIAVKPAEAWYRSLEVKRWILNINVVNTSLMLAIFITLGVLASAKVRFRLSRIPQEVVATRGIIQEPAAARPSPIPSYESTGTRSRILSAYLNGLGVVEKVTGVSMEPHTTLREFLNTSASQLPKAINLFTELTVMAEIALYSSYDLTQNEADKAEQISDAIREELDSGTA